MQKRSADLAEPLRYDMSPFLPALNISVALGIGLLIGLERGWKDRDDPDGSRVAGLRTIGLIGLLGGVLAYLDPGQGFVIAAGFVGVALLLKEGFEGQIDVTREVSVTTMIAALLAYGLGALAGFGQSQLAAAGAVVATFVLWLRDPLHRLMISVDARELRALLRWLLISVVVLPLLPNTSIGPFEAFNPRTIWLMVVIISGLGFAGYLGIKWLGPQRGIALTALMGGLVSSTAATLAFARLAKSPEQPNRALIGGTAIAWAIMIVRTAIVVVALAPAVALKLSGALLVLFLIPAITAAVLLRKTMPASEIELDMMNPLDLKSAIMFAAVLTGAMLLSKAANTLIGETGLYAVSTVAGAVDIDAISLSVAQLARDGLDAELAAIAIILAAVANTLFKGIVAAASGGIHYGRRLMPLAIAMAATGGLSAFILVA